MYKHRWFSGRMLACHAGGPGSIPGRCIVFVIAFCIGNIHVKFFFTYKTVEPKPLYYKTFFILTLFSCPALLSMKFIKLINVKMPTIVGISMMNTTPDKLKARKVFIFQHFSFYKQMKLHAQLS